MKVRVIAALLLSALALFSGCAVMDQATGSLTQALINRSGVMDRLNTYGESMMFNMVYMQVFFTGGVGLDLGSYEEGQGTEWRITSVNEDGEKSGFTTEKALLKNNPDGTQWWLLTYEGEEKDDHILYEYLIDKEYKVLKVRYKDRDSGKIQEFEPKYDESTDPAETPGEPSEELEEPDDEDMISEDEFKQYSRGTESVRVGAGTYQAEHLVYELKSEDGQEEVVYDWWIADQAPGQLVKYRFANPKEKSSVDGELMAVRNNYRTQLNSY